MASPSSSSPSWSASCCCSTRAVVPAPRRATRDTPTRHLGLTDSSPRPPASPTTSSPAPPPTTAEDTRTPGDVTVAVLNAGGPTGAAADQRRHHRCRVECGHGRQRQSTLTEADLLHRGLPAGGARWPTCSARPPTRSSPCETAPGPIADIDNVVVVLGSDTPPVGTEDSTTTTTAADRGSPEPARTGERPRDARRVGRTPRDPAHGAAPRLRRRFADRRRPGVARPADGVVPALSRWPPSTGPSAWCRAVRSTARHAAAVRWCCRGSTGSNVGRGRTRSGSADGWRSVVLLRPTCGGSASTPAIEPKA